MLQYTASNHTAEEITIRPATSADLQPLRTMVTNVIAQDAPMYAHLKLPPEIYTALYDALARGIDLDTSVVASTPSERIVACLLCGPYAISPDESRFRPACGPVMAVYGALDTWIQAKLADTPKKKVLRVMVAASKDHYRNKGIGRRLCAEVLKRASEAGWEMLVMRCTSSASQHLARDVFGCTVGEEVVYSDAEWQGKRVFEGLKGSAMLLYKHIGRTAKL